MKSNLKKGFGWLILAVISLALYLPIADHYGHPAALGGFALAVGLTSAIGFAIHLLTE